MSRRSIIKTINYLEENKLGEKKVNFRLKRQNCLVKDIGAVQYQLCTTKMVILIKFQKKCYQ